MPIPVLAGIPWLASFVVGIFGSVIAFIATYLGRWIAIIAVVLTVLTALTAAFSFALTQLLFGLVQSAPPQLNQVLMLFLPQNFTACLGAILTAHFLRWVYEWNVKIINYKAQAAK